MSKFRFYVFLILSILICGVNLSRVEAASDEATDYSESDKRVKFYMTTWCPYCRKMEAYLESAGIPYDKLDIEDNFRAKREYKALGSEGIPVLVINETVINGYDPDGVQAAWQQWQQE